MVRRPLFRSNLTSPLKIFYYCLCLVVYVKETSDMGKFKPGVPIAFHWLDRYHIQNPLRPLTKVAFLLLVAMSHDYQGYVNCAWRQEQQDQSPVGLSWRHGGNYGIFLFWWLAYWWEDIALTITWGWGSCWETVRRSRGLQASTWA